MSALRLAIFPPTGTRGTSASRTSKLTKLATIGSLSNVVRSSNAEPSVISMTSCSKSLSQLPMPSPAAGSLRTDLRVKILVAFSSGVRSNCLRRSIRSGAVVGKNISTRSFASTPTKTNDGEFDPTSQRRCIVVA